MRQSGQRFAPGSRMDTPETLKFVLVHGAWHGGWCWRDVAALLRADGHAVTTPTLTGLGERRHLLRRDTALDVFVADVVNHIEAEELDDVVLVGHSFSGAVITGVADRIPGRLRHLVYLDAVILQDGCSAFGALPPELAAARRRLADQEGGGIAIPPPDLTAFGIPEAHPLAGWVGRRLTPHPLAAYESPLRLRHPVGNGVPRTYVACTEPPYGPTRSSRDWVRGQPGWAWVDFPSGHDAMILAPGALARLLAALAATGAGDG